MGTKVRRRLLRVGMRSLSNIRPFDKKAGANCPRLLASVSACKAASDARIRSGASGAIGEPLIAELLEQGHSVVGMTTSEARAMYLRSQGADAVIADAFDAVSVEAALRHSEAEAVIDELTSLPKE
jgi:NADPH:quinone reductase-like Zn-dependent oxidoreductase